jgi:hypothetical protein
MNIKYSLVIILITWMNGKSRGDLLNLINLLLEVVYRSTTLCNHYIIRFIRFISRFHLRVIFLELRIYIKHIPASVSIDTYSCAKLQSTQQQASKRNKTE